MRYLLISILLLIANISLGQLNISKPGMIEYCDFSDSVRLRFAKFLVGNSIVESRTNIDIRIFRFQAFGDYKVIRLFGDNVNRLSIDMYSSLIYKDTLRDHRRFIGNEYYHKISKLIKNSKITQLESLDSKEILELELPLAYDGNVYDVEMKIGNKYLLQLFNNPEFYGRNYPKRAKNALLFHNFIKDLEKLTSVDISGNDESLIIPVQQATFGFMQSGQTE